MTHKVRHRAELDTDEDFVPNGVRMEKQYVKYKARDTKVQKRREREMDWYD